MTEIDLNERFNYHTPPNAKVVDCHGQARTACQTAAAIIVGVTPPSREQSIALTKLEEAMFWANAAIARNHSYYVEAVDD